MDDLKLKDLINIEILQGIQDSFYDYTGIPAVITDENGIPLTERDGGNAENADFCFKYTRSSKEGDDRCRECDKAGVLRANRTGKPAVYVCHAGLVDFAVPIILKDKVIGGIVGGQVRPSDVDEAYLRKIAAELHIDPEEYIEAAKQTFYVPLEQVEKAAEFLASSARSISIMAYEKYRAIERSRKAERVARSHNNFMLNTSIEFSEEMKKWVEEIDGISGAFMDTPEVFENLQSIIMKGQKLASMVSGAVDYMHSTGESVDFSEGEYNVRKAITDNVLALAETAAKQEVELSVEFADDLPEFFIGNSGRICLVINKIIQGCIHFAKEGRRIEVFAGYHQKIYSTDLEISIRDYGSDIDEAVVARVMQYVNSEGEVEVDEIAQKLDLPLILMLIARMSGTIKMKKMDAKTLEIHLTFPQLVVGRGE